MRELLYLSVLGGCLLAVAGLPWLLRVKVVNRRRRFALSVLPAAAMFIAWDVHAINVRHWWFNASQVTGIRFGNLPLEELLFFIVVPVCAVMAYEAIVAGKNQTWKSGGAAASDEAAGSAADSREAGELS